MKTKYKFIEFTEQEGGESWDCINKYSYCLGQVNYHFKWKEWEFCPADMIGLTIVCLRDIADFIEQLNKQGKD